MLAGLHSQRFVADTIEDATPFRSRYDIDHILRRYSAGLATGRLFTRCDVVVRTRGDNKVRVWCLGK